MTGRRSRPDFGRLVLVLAGALLATLGAHAPRARADIPSPGTASVRNEVRFEWGPLEGRVARPVRAAAGDTWETLATREAASVAWAPTIRALNGGGDAPKAEATTWVPPKALALDAKAPLFAAFLDSAKFGRNSDVSRTGLVRLDPGEGTHNVFGAVTLALVSIRSPEDAATAASMGTRRNAKETILTPPPGVRIVELGDAVTSVAAGAPLRRVVSTWRCASAGDDGGFSFTLAREERFDAAGAVIGGGGGAGETPSVSYGFIAGGVVVLALLTLLLGSRRARPSN